jgi:hypothetical protein
VRSLDPAEPQLFCPRATIHTVAACAVAKSSQLGSLARAFIQTEHDRLVSSPTRKIAVRSSSAMTGSFLADTQSCALK